MRSAAERCDNSARLLGCQERTVAQRLKRRILLLRTRSCSPPCFVSEDRKIESLDDFAIASVWVSGTDLISIIVKMDGQLSAGTLALVSSRST